MASIQNDIQSNLARPVLFCVALYGLYIMLTMKVRNEIL